MRYRLAGIALAPILIAQAWHVRRVTPRLAEPSGARAGIAGAGPPLRLLIAGDSSAAGVGVASQRDALSGQLMSALAGLFELHWRLEARTGYTVETLLDHLHAIRPEPFDVALLCVGVNDVTGHTTGRKWIARQAALIELLVGRFGVGHVIFSGLPPMHAFPALPQPLRRYLGARAARLDATLDELVQRDARCEMLRVAFPLQPDHMADDGFHPGAAAYLLWGQAAAAAIQRRVAEVSLSKAGTVQG
ncbi:MAG TPA: SGNH/GDSL hydrolase family protein [Rudaea sp.]|jgi:lysophospholipase L1-like esterase